MATEPMDMRSGTEKALARVVAFFGAAQSHGADLFAKALGRLILIKPLPRFPSQQTTRHHFFQ